MNIKGFKPNLIPNNPKDGTFGDEELKAVIEKNGGAERYLIMLKKDGCRMQLGLSDKILSRSLKEPKSILVRERFERLNQICKELKITLDGEFYAHGMKFNEIFRFFSNTDVTSEKYRVKLEKEQAKDPGKFYIDYNGRSIEFLTTFHEQLAFWPFDGLVLDRPDLVGFEERMLEIHKRLFEYQDNMLNSYCMVIAMYQSQTFECIKNTYEKALETGWEGLVLTHKDHEYKFGRNSIKQGTILKMKDDSIEYDGVILDVEEASKSKEGTEVTRNELGGSVRSQKKEDREPSGLAKGFVVEFEGKGTFTVGLRGFDNEAKRELLKNKEEYIGRHFKYTAMAPVKDFPRHAYFDTWRDEK